jgi:O-antigen/teichoic acid export membrane protein
VSRLLQPERAAPTPTEDVRRRAQAGAVIDSVRGVATRLVGFAGTVVLARLLVPRDLGLVAFGTTLMAFATFLADGGVGKALVRRLVRPERAELRALLGLQLTLTTALAVVSFAVAWPFGQVGRVTGIMLLALPFTALRAPGMILLERDLSFRPIAIAEIAEAFVYFAWAVATVASGWGVWGLATATVARSCAGSLMLFALAPGGRVPPGFSWSRLKPLLGFGLRYQAVGVAALARDQAVNVGTAAIGGIAVLGLWSVAYRLLQVPFLLFGSLWRVSFPAMARLVAAGEDLRGPIERAAALVAVATGLLVSPLVASAPALVPSVLGERWRQAAEVLPPAGLGLMFGGPISVAVFGYLWATGDARTPLRASLLGIPAWLGITFPLLPVLGVFAVGLGWLAGSCAESLILARSVFQRVRADVVSPLVAPATIAACSAALGWIVAASGKSSLFRAGLGLLVGESVYLVGLILLRRSLLSDLVGTTIHAVRASVAAPSNVQLD